MKKRERNETRKEKPNDWSIRAPEWYQARPIGTVHHLRDPIHRSGSGRRTKPSREDRGDPYRSPFSVLLPPLPLFPFRERMQTPVHGGCETIDQLHTCHLEPGICTSLEKSQTSDPEGLSLEENVDREIPTKEILPQIKRFARI